MDRINAFISYASEEKQIGGRLKQLLIHYCGYDTLSPMTTFRSEVWEKKYFTPYEADFFILSFRSVLRILHILIRKQVAPCA